MKRKYQYQKVDFWAQSIIAGSILLCFLSALVFPAGLFFGIFGLMPLGAWQVLSGIVFGIFYRDVKHLLYLAAVAAYFLTAYSAIWVGKSHDAPYIFLSIAAFIGIIYFVWTRFEFLNADKTPTPKTAYFDDILDA